MNTKKVRYNGKLSLTPGEPLYVICHNDLTKKECDDCLNCFSPTCNGEQCDAHNECLCVRTECKCLGRQ